MSEPRKYRKRPVVIETMRFDGSDESGMECAAWVSANGGLATHEHPPSDRDAHLIILTLEGNHLAQPGGALGAVGA